MNLPPKWCIKAQVYPVLCSNPRTGGKTLNIQKMPATPSGERIAAVDTSKGKTPSIMTS